jgi:hypothetical protein
MSSSRGKGSRTTATFVLFVLLGTATGSTEGQSAPATDSAPADAAANATFALSAKNKGLEIPQGAERVRYRANPGDCIQVSCIVHEPYPAKRAIKEISSRLTNAGWKPFKANWLNPTANSPQVRRWSQYVDETGGELRDYWMWRAAWQDDKGDLIEYAIGYSRPFRSKDRLSEASISGSWTSAAKAKSDREIAKRAGESAPKSGEHAR